MAVETFLSGGWPLSSWISPGAAFFLFVNMLIGAIVVTSRGHQHQGGRAASTRRLCRSASSMVLDRLRSFSIFSVHPAVPVEDYYSNSTSSAPELELEAEELELEQQHQPAVAEPARPPVAAAVAAPDADGGASSEIAKEEAPEAGQDMSTASSDDDEAAAHGPALQGHGRQQPPSVDDVVAADEAAAAVESQSEEEMMAETSVQQRAPAACRRETEEEALEGKAALNARAESFIRRFREDLKLERLNSIINYTRTLRRGGSAGAPSPTAHQ